MMQRGDEFPLRLDDAAFEGKNIGRREGLVVFVRGGVPGDIVMVRLTKIKKQFLEGDASTVLEPSPRRVAARCRHFGTCGGCVWQEFAYDGQLDAKRRHVVDALERIGGFQGVEVKPTLGSQEEYYYRNKMEFSFGDRWRTREEMAAGIEQGIPSFALGLHIPGRYDKVLDVQECWLQSATSAGIVNLTREFARERGLPIYDTRTHTGYLRNLVIREAHRTGESMVNLVTFENRPAVMQAYAERLLAAYPAITTIVNNVTERKSQVAVGEWEQVCHGPGFITEMIGERRYRISANSFFQTNTRQAERLYDVAAAMASLTGKEVVYDLYCGTGTISLHVAARASRVVGIESVPQAIQDARANAEANGVSNCTFLLGDLKDRLTEERDWIAEQGPPDVVIVDPPRSGMHERVAREVVAFRPKRIVYVSCNPATQARDLKIMTETGGYRLVSCQPVDMFPHTYHIENVVLLEPLA